MKKNFVKAGVGALLTVVFILVVGFIWRVSSVPQVSNGDSQRLAAKSLGRSLKEGEVEFSDGIYEGENFSLKYPETVKPFGVEKLQNKDPNIVEYFSFDGYNPRLVFTATVTAFKNQNLTSLDEVPAVKMRLLDARTYKNEKINIDGNTAVVFIKESEGFEEVAFVLKNGEVYTFSVTAQSGGSRVSAEFREVLKTVKFN